MIDPIDLRVTSYLPQSGSAAGGMTVGLTTSGIIVHHIPSGIGVTVDSERSQHANKEKALQLLQSLVIAIKAQDQYEQSFQQPVHPHNRVKMIKETREQTGYGLKESKEAVDRFGNVEEAVAYLNGLNPTKAYEGHCRMGDHCLCGGDVPAVSEGCFEWKRA